MLGINRSHSPENSVLYFTKNLSFEGENYLEEEVVAHWYGKIAARLGLEGKQVTKEDFRALVYGRHHQTGETLRVRKVSNARSGYDFTWSAPKSVSIALFVTGDQDILHAHQKAYMDTLAEIQNSVQTQANTVYGRFWEDTGELIVAPFDHFLSRPCEVKIDGKKSLYISDPQLHTHAYIPALTYSHKNQRFQAIELGNVHAEARYWEARYHSALALELENLGYATRRTRDRFELEGISRDQIMRYSNRSKIIDKVALEKGIIDKREKTKLSVLTRNSKSKGLKKEELEEHWFSRLSKKEIEAIQSMKGRPSQSREHITAKEAIERSIQHHCERNSAFKEKDVLAYALKLGYGHLSALDAKKALNERKDIVRADFNTIIKITTHEMIHEEDFLLSSAVNGKNKFAPINEHHKLKSGRHNESQKNAVHEMLGSRDLLTILSGFAGTGKTSVIEELNYGVTGAGKQLFLIAPTSKAVESLRSKGYQAETIAGYLQNKQAHEKLYGQVLAIDEAGMCGIKTSNEVLKLVQDKGARLWLIGDTNQHAPPAQRGDAMHLLQQKGDIKTVRLQEIVRQKESKYLSAVGSFSKNRTLEGFKKLEQMGAVHEEGDKDIRLKKMAKDFTSVIKSGRTCIAVSPTRAEGNQINELIREEHRKAKLIKGKEREITTYQNLSFTDQDKKDRANYQDGQILTFINNVRGNYRAGVPYEVITGKKPSDLNIRNTKTGETLTLPLEHSGMFQVFDQQKIPISQGDTLKMTQNSRTKENGKITNGTVVKVAGFTKSGDIKLDNGKTLSNDIGHVRYSYCDTSHAAQGRDADEVIVSVSELSFNTASREQMYVSVSRGKYAARLYTSDSEELKKSIQRTEKRISAREVADAAKRQTHLRNQRNHHHNLNQQIREQEFDRRREKQATKELPASSPTPKARE